VNKNSEIRVAIGGASGYVGTELLRYLAMHPQAKVVACLGHSQQGQAVADLFPNLVGFYDDVLVARDWSQLGGDADLVFLCLPHGQSQEPARALVGAGCKVIDLGADFRLRDPEVYARTYEGVHGATDLLAEAVYGLPELHREAIKGCRLVANPGCYPTASGLALLPMIKEGLLREPTIIDAKSGVSGAGRAAAIGSLYAEVNETIKAYGVGGHRHQPEIEQTVGQKVVFTPHLTPMTRGILATVYVRHEPADLAALYRDFYANEPFVRVLPKGLPTTKATLGSNYCHIAVRDSGYPGCSIVLSAIDNLGKGAAGTAVHNMNLLFGLPEETGLRFPGLAP
jgi:N-acetyl-gamma-glutamyl-phosphate reductase